MSYQDIVQRGNTRELQQYGTSNEQANRALISSVFSLQTDVRRLRTDVDRLGTQQDTLDLRQKIGASISRLQGSAVEIKDKLTAAHKAQKSPQTTKILSDYEAVLREFQSLMKSAKRREASSLPRRPEPAALAAALVDSGEKPGDEVEQQALLQEQKRVEARILESEMSYNEALIDEREAGITEIAQQIGEVSEIMQDLAVLVHDQGGMLDDIEANISNTAASAQGATVEIGKAERYQRSARNRMCLIMVIVGAILAVLVLVFLKT